MDSVVQLNEAALEAARVFLGSPAFPGMLDEQMSAMRARFSADGVIRLARPRKKGR